MATVMSNNYTVNFETHTPVWRTDRAIGAHTRFTVSVFFAGCGSKGAKSVMKKEKNDSEPLSTLSKENWRETLSAMHSLLRDQIT